MTEQQTLPETTAAETTPAPQSIPVGGGVWVLMIETEHGTSSQVFASAAGAKASLIGFVDEWWDQEMDEERPADDDAAIEAYFEDTADEFYSLTETTIQR